MLALMLPAISDLCANDDPQMLTATAVGGVGGGTFTWSGPGITNPNGTFDPSTVIPGNISLNLEYMEGVCSYDTTSYGNCICGTYCRLFSYFSRFV